MPRPGDARRERLHGLAAREFDTVIIGGGATGAAIARDAVLRGLRVALCEHGDFAGQTSSQSSKLLHGGLRYLQYLDLHLVFEGLRERRLLMRAAPHLCRATSFVFPAYRHERPTLAMLGVGIRLYNLLALGRQPATRSRLSASQLFSRVPLLRSAGLQGAQIYGDCQTDDARLVLENILDAESAGAVCVSYLAAVGLHESPAGGLRGLRVEDRLTGSGFTVHARTVINATGPFSDTTAALAGWTRGDSRPAPRLRPTLGVHLVFDGARLPTAGRAFVLRTPRDNRLFFALPDGGFTIVGTTDTDWRAPGGGAPRVGDEIRAHRADIDYLLEAVNHNFPAARLRPADVVSTFAGLRPLVADPGASPSATSREHEILTDARGLLTVAGGKLTTMREMGQNAVDRLIDLLRARGFEGPTGPCLTRTRPLPGGVGGDSSTHAPSPSRLDLPEPARAHLLARYGARAPRLHALLDAPGLTRPIVPGLPDLRAEVLFAVRHEHAQSVEDVLRRRTHIFRHASDQGLAAARDVATLLASELDWSTARQDASLSAYAAAVSASCRWQEDPVPSPIPTA